MIKVSRCFPVSSSNIVAFSAFKVEEDGKKVLTFDYIQINCI